MLSSEAFFQVNLGQTVKLYNKVLEKKPEGKVELPTIESILAPAKNVIVKKEDSNVGMPSIAQLLGREYNEVVKPVAPVAPVVNKPVQQVAPKVEVKQEVKPVENTVNKITMPIR